MKIIQLNASGSRALMNETAEQHSRLWMLQISPSDIFVFLCSPKTTDECCSMFSIARSLSQRVLCCALFSLPFPFTAWNLQHFMILSNIRFFAAYWEIATKKISINDVCRSKTQIYLGGAWPVRGFDDRKIAFVKTQRTRSLMNVTIIVSVEFFH